MSISVQANTPDKNLRRLNNILTIFVVGLGLYLLIAPLWPEITFWIKQHSGGPTTIAYTNNITEDNSGTKPTPQENRLVVPQMDLDKEIHEGRYASTLSKGVWHRPQTSTPDKGGNTVLVAHRFTYKSPATFYHLDKLKEKDRFIIFWGGKEYDYQVREVRIVNPTDVYIEENTNEPIVTLYSCTPMWTAKQRLVVIADLITENQP